MEVAASKTAECDVGRIAIRLIKKKKKNKIS
jgi:hypothetical protein